MCSSHRAVRHPMVSFNLTGMCCCFVSKRQAPVKVRLFLGSSREHSADEPTCILHFHTSIKLDWLSALSSFSSTASELVAWLMLNPSIISECVLLKRQSIQVIACLLKLISKVVQCRGTISAPGSQLIPLCTKHPQARRCIDACCSDGCR